MAADRLGDGPAHLRLSATEQELVETEIRAFGASLREPAHRVRYADLADRVVTGIVPVEHLDQLATVLQIGLETGRLRRMYGADGEQTFGRIFQRTPRGAAVASETAAVTTALQALRGQVIDDLRVTALGPGAYSILVDTRECQITIRLDRGGARVDNVAVGI